MCDKKSYDEQIKKLNNGPKQTDMEPYLTRAYTEESTMVIDLTRTEIPRVPTTTPTPTQSINLISDESISEDETADTEDMEFICDEEPSEEGREYEEWISSTDLQKLFIDHENVEITEMKFDEKKYQAGKTRRVYLQGSPYAQYEDRKVDGKDIVCWFVKWIEFK